jgi:hypothetical protein
MNNYYNKYIKYKTKYLALKNSQSGGAKKVFNLSAEYDYKKGNLQKNLIEFEKEYGNNFQIKYEEKDKKIIIDVNLIKVKKINGVEFYRMIYDIPHRTSDLTPFIINFIDITTAQKNNNSYIANIHKTDKISGSDLVKICIEINRILGAEKTALYDGTRITCEKNNEKLDLSLLKLIEKDKTFYMNLGFKLTNDQLPFFKHLNESNLQREINRLLLKIRSIKTIDLIKEYQSTMELITKIIKDNYSKKLEIKKIIQILLVPYKMKYMWKIQKHKLMIYMLNVKIC